MKKEVVAISSSQAAGPLLSQHYLHRVPNSSYCYGLFINDVLRGVVTYGVPASRELQIGVNPTAPEKVLELNRLWVDDSEPANSESWFVARTLRLLPPHIVVSYADPQYGHMGIVYRALNFRYAGWTDMDRKTPRLDYIPLDPAMHTREASRSGISSTVRRVPKVRYWTVSGTPLQRRFMARACAWPTLDWHTNPPPVPTTVKARQYVTPRETADALLF